MHIRDRIKELRRVRASELRPHPHNWRSHPQRQQDALRGVLAEIGYADALLARELPDGSLQLVDGHLRAETTPDAIVPVLVLDLDDSEADKLLLTLDPLSAMAGVNERELAELLERTASDNAAVNEMLADLASKLPNLDAALNDPEVAIPASYQVVIDCADESQQEELYERLSAEGLKCKVLTL